MQTCVYDGRGWDTTYATLTKQNAGIIGTIPTFPRETWLISLLKNKRSEQNNANILVHYPQELTVFGRNSSIYTTNKILKTSNIYRKQKHFRDM